MYSMGMFAQLAAVTTKALRHYERVGLLTPMRTDAGYRRYSIDDLRRLDRVLALKSLGLRLDVIKAVLDGDGGDRLSLDAHRQTLEATRARLDHAIDALRQATQHPRPLEGLEGFIREAIWTRWEIERAGRADPGPRAPDRAAPSRVALFHELAGALGEDPAGIRALGLAREWRAAIDDTTWEAVRHRDAWPVGMRAYVASLYDVTPDVWEPVVAFVEANEGV
jgi:DNA-binding transcriptional MerR regulator